MAEIFSSDTFIKIKQKPFPRLFGNLEYSRQRDVLCLNIVPLVAQANDIAHNRANLRGFMSSTWAQKRTWPSVAVEWIARRGAEGTKVDEELDVPVVLVYRAIHALEVVLVGDAKTEAEAVRAKVYPRADLV